METKTANFYYNGTNYFVDLDERNQCFVPKEVIYSPSFDISVYGGDIITNYVRNYVDGAQTNSGGNNTSSVVFIPSISEDGVLTWTNNGGLDNPISIDLTPFGDQDSTGINTLDAGTIIERS